MCHFNAVAASDPNLLAALYFYHSKVDYMFTSLTVKKQGPKEMIAYFYILVTILEALSFL